MYPNAIECVWHIQTAMGTRVKLTIPEFDLEPSHGSDGGCIFDHLSIYGGPDRTSPRLAQLCAKTSNPTEVTSTGNNMLVAFYSDGSVRGKGFSARFSTEQNGN